MYMVCAINFCQNLLKISKFFFVKQERQLLQQEFFNKNVIFLYSSFFFQTPHKTFSGVKILVILTFSKKSNILYGYFFRPVFFFFWQNCVPFLCTSLSVLAVWLFHPGKLCHIHVFTLIASQVGAFTHLIKFWCNLYVFSVFLYQCIFNEK